MNNEKKEELGNFEKIDCVKIYFAKIFNVLDEEVRKEYLKLDLPKDKHKKLLKELAFLTKEKQIKYLEEMKKKYSEKST